MVEHLATWRNVPSNERQCQISCMKSKKPARLLITGKSGLTSLTSLLPLVGRLVWVILVSILHVINQDQCHFFSLCGHCKEAINPPQY